jgi:plasmid maintenance system killer protein
VPRFNDQRLLEIFLYGRTAGVPARDCAVIRRKLRLLLATSRWTGIDIVGDAFALQNGRIAMMPTVNWGISFLWSEGDGAFEMQLEP